MQRNMWYRSWIIIPDKRSEELERHLWAQLRLSEESPPPPQITFCASLLQPMTLPSLEPSSVHHYDRPRSVRLVGVFALLQQSFLPPPPQQRVIRTH